MTATQTQGNWNIMKGKLKQKWANLTDDDLLNVEGKAEELVGRIQKRTGEARDEIKRFLSECDSDCDCR
ncbi:MAG: CsbD family protein [Prosthecobacter sp.]|nr:CsbD family protein [Prosthecobacter sp.]